VTGRSRRRPGSGGEPEQVLYVPDPVEAGRTVALTGSEADHARRSLRLRTGAPVSLVDGRGSRYHGEVAGLGKARVEVRVRTVETLTPWPHRPLWLGAGILRSTRMDTLVEKASELGVARLVPLLLERVVARPHEAGVKEDRWHRLAVESLKQSKRAHLMEVASPSPLAAFLDAVPEEASLWWADPGGVSPLAAVRATPAGAAPRVLVVGPEGGLSPSEAGVLGDRGGIPVGLGGNRLRAETAALVLVSAALAAAGEMGKTAD
jgi:16S rRNA (uracil1498-N3)-methyltransferase